MVACRWQGVCADLNSPGGAKTGRIADTRGMEARGWEHMLLIIGVLLAAIAAVIVYRTRVPGGVNDAQLGRISERWLAEHRASNQP